MTIFYFTTTGNSLFVAKALSNSIYSIPQLLKNRSFQFEDTAIGFVFPCYYGDVPGPVADFIRQATLKASYFFAVITYGHQAGIAPYHLRRLMAKAKKPLHYVKTLPMVDNFTPYFDLDNQLRYEEYLETDRRLARITNAVERHLNRRERYNILSFTLFYFLQKLHAFMSPTVKKQFFTISSACNGCGICGRVCPRENFIFKDNRPNFQSNCILCLACFHHCPQKAIIISEHQKSGQFRHRQIDLADIIRANEQNTP